MTTFFVQQYIEEVSDLCEKLHWDELEYVLPKLIDVLPYLNDYCGEIFTSTMKNEVSRFIDLKAFESAIVQLIPKNIRVTFYKDDNLKFDFYDRERPHLNKSYSSSSLIFSMGLFSSYLRFLLEAGDLIRIEQSDAFKKNHLRLV